MNIYPLARPLLFALDPEVAHHCTLNSLSWANKLGVLPWFSAPELIKPVRIMGLEFKNALGLAAGLDKNGDYIDALGGLGFGFVEIGTVTPRPQPGNPKPRLFRLPEQQAIINRMGFNNAGIEHLLVQAAKRKFNGILGINIGKNADTPLAEAAQDYLIGLRKSYALADYVTVNISSPNTQNLRQLQQGDEIKRLLAVLKEEQAVLQAQHGKYTPIVIKIAPDLSAEELMHIARLLREYAFDGVIATNTTIDRAMLGDHPLAKEAGGLSGAPVKAKATHVVAALKSELSDAVPIIAAGGILTAADAQEKFAAGASLVQIYSGLIYQGPQLVTDILRQL